MGIFKYPDPVTGEHKAIDSGAINDGDLRFTPQDIKGIDDKLKTTNELLAETVEQKEKRTKNKRKAFITIIDDDGKVDFITKGHRDVVANHPKAKISLAINAGLVGTTGFLSWSEIETLKNNPQIEFVNHGWVGTHALDLTLEQLKSNYQLEKSAFEQHGLNGYDYFVYSGLREPDQYSNADLKNKLRQVYKCNLSNAGAKEAYIPFDAYDVKRFGAYFGSTTNAYIDDCIKNQRWCVLMSHSWADGQDGTKLESLLTYIDSKVDAGLIEYKSVKEMVDNYSNVFDLGNGADGQDYFRLDQNGLVDFSVLGRSINSVVTGLNAIESKVNFPSANFSDAPISSYTQNSITVENLIYSDSSKYGLPDAGLVITYKTNSDVLSSQIYLRANRSDMWTRKWNSTNNRWDLFTPVNSINANTRTRFAYEGYSMFDATLSKPVWRKGGNNFTPNKTIARNTAFNKYDVVSFNAWSAFMCVQAGTTGASEPTWSYSYNTQTTDGTVKWEYVGSAPATWVDATGTTV